MAKVFVLEDSMVRIEIFRNYLKNHQVTYCDNVETAKSVLEKEDFDIIFFDHDLDDRVFVKSSEPNTGYQLAKWLKKNNKRFQQIIIHSMNPVGSYNIYEEVRALSPFVRIIPFMILTKEFFNENGF